MGVNEVDAVDGWGMLDLRFGWLPRSGPPADGLGCDRGVAGTVSAALTSEVLELSRVAHAVHIEAPAADVWAAMMDLENWPVWASQFKRFERLDGPGLALDSRVRVWPKGLPASVWQVTEFQEGRSFTWASRVGPGVHVTGGHLLTPNPKGTSAQFWLEANGPLGSLLGPVLQRLVFSRNTRTATQGLKRHVEQQVPAAAAAEGVGSEL